MPPASAKSTGRTKKAGPLARARLGFSWRLLLGYFAIFASSTMTGYA